MIFADKIAAIQQIALHNLPGEKAHADLMPVNRPFSSQVKLNAENYRESAVAIVLYEEADNLMSLLIQRPNYEGVHSQQIAFPGGKRDPEDSDIDYTARRECMEEVAIPMDQLSLIGRLTDVYIPVSKFIVSPHIYALGELPELTPDTREVAEIISFDTSILLDDGSIQHMDMKFGNGFTQKNVPYFAIENRVVWGATGMILSEFKSILQEL